jgi:hypothetical protein
MMSEAGVQIRRLVTCIAVQAVIVGALAAGPGASALAATSADGRGGGSGFGRYRERPVVSAVRYGFSLQPRVRHRRGHWRARERPEPMSWAVVVLPVL